MIAYLKRNLQVRHLAFFKPETFDKTYENISRLEMLRLSVEHLPFVFLIPVLITAFVGGLFEFLGLGFNWLNALIALGKAVAFVVAFGIAFGMVDVGFGVLFTVSVSVVFGVAVGVGVGVAADMAGLVAFTVALGVALGMAVGWAVSIAGGGFDSLGVGFGMILGEGFGVILGVTLGVALGVAIGVAFSVAFSVAFGVIFGVAYFRFFDLINYLIYYFKNVHQPIWTSFAKLPILYDEVILFPLPRLHRLLAAFVKADRTDGMKAINFIIQERPFQLPQARRALFEIAVHDLSNMQAFRQIAAAPQAIGFLQGVPENVLPEDFQRGSPYMQAIPYLVAQYLDFATIYSRRKQLEVIAQEIKDFQLVAAYLKGYVGRGFVKVAYAWGELVKAEETALQRQIETEPIPNPFVVGNPLRREDKEVFQGREDVARMLESEIMRDKSMSPLLLYGKRRIGKTSALNNLQKLLGPGIIPVIFDCQNVGLAESDAGFLYYFLNKIHEKVPGDWVTPGDSILPNRQEFDKHPFEMSNKFFDHLSTRMESNNFRLMLCFDEYETLNRYYEEKRITDNLLGQLRHYIQHQTRLAFLFAGAHRMIERRAIRWSDYLINVKTIKLGFLDHASAEKLITAPIPDWPLKYEPGVVEQILQITHRQPYLLQAVASDLVDYLNTQQRTRATMADLEEAIQRVLVTAELYFQNTWEEDLTEPERALILAYLRADGKVDPVANKEVLHGLVQNDIFEVTDGRHVFVIDLFKRWIVKNLPV